VGRSWPTEFYRWIPDSKIRGVMEKIADETEEDYQSLIACLKSLKVDVIRPSVDLDIDKAMYYKRLPKPPMCPRDNMIMLGHTLVETVTDLGIGNEELLDHKDDYSGSNSVKLDLYQDIFRHVKKQGNNVESLPHSALNAAMIYQLPGQILFSTWPSTDRFQLQKILKQYRPDVDSSMFYHHGHIDGWFAPVNKHVLFSSSDESRPELLNLFYQTYFKNAKVVYLDPSMASNFSFIRWQKINKRSWWIPGQENNLHLQNFVDEYFNHWLGQISETVFEVNMIIIDEHTVIVSNYNDTVFKHFDKFGITAHICKFRHQTFWDSGVNCLTCELDRKTEA
jgi:hypothetical protein